MEMNNELIARAKKAKSSEELMTLAKENGEELTEESAKEYFELLNPKTGELSTMSLIMLQAADATAKTVIL